MLITIPSHSHSWSNHARGTWEKSGLLGKGSFLKDSGRKCPIQPCFWCLELTTMRAYVKAICRGAEMYRGPFVKSLSYCPLFCLNYKICSIFWLTCSVSSGTSSLHPSQERKSLSDSKANMEKSRSKRYRKIHSFNITWLPRSSYVEANLLPFSGTWTNKLSFQLKLLHWVWCYYTERVLTEIWLLNFSMCQA